jgi:hypothetical protein
MFLFTVAAFLATVFLYELAGATNFKLALLSYYVNIQLVKMLQHCRIRLLSNN